MTETHLSNPDQARRRSVFVPYTKESIRKYVKLLPQIDLNGPLEEEGAWHEGRFTEDARESTGTELKGKWEFSELVVLGNDPIAYLIGTYGTKDYPWTPKEDIFIFRLGVALRYRGSGIGTGLIHNLAGKTVDRQILGIHLETSSTNLQAHRFYEKAGFKKTGQRQDARKDILFYSYSGEAKEVLERTSRA